MKAVAFERFGGPEVLAMHERPDPAPGPREALVRVRACGVSLQKREILRLLRRPA